MIKYYKFINYNLIYNNKAINRYKKDNFEISEDKAEKLKLLKKINLNLKIATWRKMQIILYLVMNQSKIMFVVKPQVQMRMEGLTFVGRAGNLLDKMLAQ